MTEFSAEQRRKLLKAFAYTSRGPGKFRDFYQPPLSRRARRRRRGKYKAAFKLFHEGMKGISRQKGFMRTLMAAKPNLVTSVSPEMVAQIDALKAKS